MLREYAEEFIALFKFPRVPVMPVDDIKYRLTPGEYGDSLGEIIVPPVAGFVAVATLTGFVDGYHTPIDEYDPAKTFVQVVSPSEVLLLDLDADRYGRRHCYIKARNEEVNAFRFGEFYPPDGFALALESSFEPTEDVSKLVQLASNLTSSSSVQTADDGISQTVAFVSGTVTKSKVDLPRRIPLAPFRTFREAPQVMTHFLVRMKGVPTQVPTIALYEVDGNKWKLDAMQSVKHWLAKELPDAVIIA